MMLALMSFHNSRSMIIWINSINDNPWCHHSVFFLSVCLHILSQMFPVVTTFFIGSLLMVWSKNNVHLPSCTLCPADYWVWSGEGVLCKPTPTEMVVLCQVGREVCTSVWFRQPYIFCYIAQSTLVPKECDCFFLMIIVSLASSHGYQQIHNTSWLPVMFVTFCCKLTLIFLANEQKW